LGGQRGLQGIKAEGEILLITIEVIMMIITIVVMTIAIEKYQEAGPNHLLLES
jgi:hypothetical protein